jgi:hypothetical protein
MARIKLVVWERRSAWMQAQEVLKREQQKAEWVKEGLSDTEIASKMKDMFPEPIEFIGKAPHKTAKAKRQMAKMGRRKQNAKKNTSWTIV